MSYARRESVTITTDGSGDATGYLPSPPDLANSEPYLTGKLITLIYDKDDYAAGVDFVITVEETGELVWSQLNVNASVTKAPRQAEHDTAGAASLYAAIGEPVEGYIVLAHDRIKIVVDQGGAANSGTFTVIVA